MFTLLITGEGPADRRAITDSPQARGWERYKHPSLSPKCDGNVQLSRGSLHWQNPRVQREILKTWEELAELALTGGTLEKSKWEAGGIAKVSFKAKWSLDKAQTLVYTHKCSRSYQTQAGELHKFWSAKKASNKMVFISTTKTVTVFSKTYHRFLVVFGRNLTLDSFALLKGKCFSALTFRIIQHDAASAGQPGVICRLNKSYVKTSNAQIQNAGFTL